MSAHEHAATSTRTTHNDEFGVRVVEQCECGAYRTVEHWTVPRRENPETSAWITLGLDG